MTTSKLFLRSIRKNIKLYYLYFFSMIFSISLYYIFATLQHDPSVKEMTDHTSGFSNAFLAAGILLVVIISVFTIYANGIFLRRRSQEIGLYQLIGLSKSWVIRFLVVEQVVLGFGSLLIGIAIGALLSRLFLVVLINLIGLDGVAGLPFSFTATIQTIVVFTMLIAITIMQIIRLIAQNRLIDLFRAEKQKDPVKKPNNILSGLLALIGVGLIAFGYYVSGIMLDDTETLLMNMGMVLASTILGTYLFFRVSISWIFYQYRKKKNGNLGLKNSLSIAPLMHRMRGNANSLTLITVLSAMTITMVSLAYSLYYSVENDTKLAMPFDFAMVNMEDTTETFMMELDKEEITYEHHPIEALQVTGDIPNINWGEGRTILFFPAEQLQQAGVDVEAPESGEAVYYNSRAMIEGMDNTVGYPKEVELVKGETILLTELVLENIMNVSFFGEQFLVSEETFKAFKVAFAGEEDLLQRFDTIQVENEEERAQASAIYGALPEERLMSDYHSMYQSAFQMNGLFIFVTAFLGLVFLISTGSILYFKQMTEAEQEKQYYKTLRQLGFSEFHLMQGIVRKQFYVFCIPLIIGIMHAIFALKVGSILVISSIIFPAMVGIVLYVVIYLLFAILTISYYRKIVRSVM